MTNRRPTLHAVALQAITLVMGVLPPSVAAAQPTPACPPDEWFCDDGSEPGALEPSVPPSEPAPSIETGPEEPAEEPAAVRRWSSDEPGRAAPELDLRADGDPLSNETSRQGNELTPSAWSVNLRVQGVMLGHNRRRGGGQMGGAGAGLRYRVSPGVSFELGIDSVIGTDYNGYDRGELALSLSALLYLNQHPAVRTYTVFGVNSSAARVEIGTDERSFGYFGGHAGLGLEIPLARRLALSVDLVGFIRGRTDSAAARQPEFSDGLGRVTNTAGGGLLRAGLSLSW